MLSVISLSLLISGCAVTPPDVPLCTEISPNRGFCVNTISSKEFEINDTQLYNEKSWWDLRPLMIYMPSDSWKEIKSFIIKVCKMSKKCKHKQVSSWERTVKTIDSKVMP